MPIHFHNPIILWGLISLIIPVIIHLFNFKRFKKIYFSNLKFLKDVTAENKNRSKIKNWLLLLSRLLALTCLIIAFAQPFIPNENTNLADKSQKQVVQIYVDNSFSMNAETEKGIAIEIAKAKAIDLINSLPDDAQINIHSNNSKSNTPLVNKKRAISKIQELQPSTESKSFTQIIKECSQTNFNHSIYFFSDFQKYQFNIDQATVDSSQNIILMPLKIQNQNNLYVDSCWHENMAHKINQKEELYVRIQNASNKNYNKIPIKLYINDSLKSVTNFDIKPKENKAIKLHYKSQHSGIHSGRIEINDYPITYDNTLFFSYKIQKNAEIISINQEKENLYISQLFSNKEYFNLKNISKTYFHQANLSQTKLIILNQLTNMQSGFKQNIAKYINRGGQVLILPADKNNVSNNELLSELGVGIYQDLDSLTQTVSSIELNAEIYKEVFKQLKDNARLPQIYRHFKLGETNQHLHIPLWKTKMGESLFSQIKLGKGKLFLSSFNFTPQWTNAIKHPLFVPSLINIVLNNHRHSPLYFNLDSKEYAIADGVSSKGEKNMLHIENKLLGIDLIPEQINHFDRGLLLNAHGQIKEAGNYLITQANHPVAGISFNYTRKESNLDFYSTGELNDLIRKNNLNYSLMDVETIDMNNALTEQREGKSYWSIFLILSFFFLITEFIIQKIKL